VADVPVTVTRQSFTAHQLERLRRLVQSAARRAGLSTQRSLELVLAVNEAATNAIKYAGGRGRVRVVEEDRHRVVAVISDAGPGLPDELTVAEPPPGATRGRGLWLIHKVCDRVELRSGADGTRIRLEMSLPSR
jgi:anti-sigma regulatory factor (Ser/Thr protein kinase)